ncbi:MAG: anthranilate synthase component I family protein [Pirellulales bacterium]|nr:anthranilate synthase component I family protein [Pirellulales bacterium]
MKPFVPLVEELRPAPEAEAVFGRLSGLPHCLFLDSALVDPRLGRYSFVTADPFDYRQWTADDQDALGPLEQWLEKHHAATLPGLPPFQGGAAGVFGYELGRQFETLPESTDEFGLPVLALGLYDVVVAFDHVDHRAWIISQGLPELEPTRRARRAAERLEWFKNLCAKEVGWGTPALPSSHDADSRWGKCAPPYTQLDRAELSSRYPVPGVDGVWSNFSHEAYLEAAQRAVDYVLAGDVFQVNLAQRLLCEARDDSVTLYSRLRRCNPAPFAGYFDLGPFQIVSASPERFLKLTGRDVETRPIKGTRRRAVEPKADEAIGRELLKSEKDRAENVMIVDLLRNDLSRVCEPACVRVADLCRLETYQFVHHLVSSVHGRLAKRRGPLDLIRAAFPGGSITGAPKVRAMEIITELERVARGPYCGSLGYLGFDGSMDLSILIRTITAGRGWWQAPVGGGIVAQSVPQREYEETLHKAEGLLRAMLPDA